MKNLFRLSKLLLNELIEVLGFPILYIPGTIGNILRHLYWKRRLNFLGKKSVIDVGVQIYNPAWVSIGTHTHIDRFVILCAGPIQSGEKVFFYKENMDFKGEIGQLIIGDNVHVAPKALINGNGGVIIGNNSGVAAGGKIYSVSHYHKNPNDPADCTLFEFSSQTTNNRQCIIIGPVVMQERSGLGIGSVVLPGSTIGRNSWIGVLSRVSGKIPPNVIALGCPAKIISGRSEE